MTAKHHAFNLHELSPATQLVTLGGETRSLSYTAVIVNMYLSPLSRLMNCVLSAPIIGGEGNTGLGTVLVSSCIVTMYPLRAGRESACKSHIRIMVLLPTANGIIALSLSTGLVRVEEKCYVM